MCQLWSGDYCCEIPSAFPRCSVSKNQYFTCIKIEFKQSKNMNFSGRDDTQCIQTYHTLNSTQSPISKSVLIQQTSSPKVGHHIKHRAFIFLIITPRYFLVDTCWLLLSSSYGNKTYKLYIPKCWKQILEHCEPLNIYFNLKNDHSYSLQPLLINIWMKIRISNKKISKTIYFLGKGKNMEQNIWAK